MPRCPPCRASLDGLIARRWLSSSSPRRQESARDALRAMEACGRVEVLPFSIDRAHVMAQADQISRTTSVFAQSSGKWNLAFNLISGALLKRLGLLSVWDSWTKRILSLEDAKPVYLPIFAVHAVASFSCKVNVTAQSKWSVRTKDLVVPGFAWSPLDKLRIGFTDEQLERLEPLDLKKHAAQLADESVTILPYTRDPLSLPAALDKAADTHRVLSFASARPGRKFVRQYKFDDDGNERDDDADPDEPCHADEAAEVEEALEQSEETLRLVRSALETSRKDGAEEVDTATVQDPILALEPESLTSYMTAYPILFPVWLLKMRVDQTAGDYEEGEVHSFIVEGAEPSVLSKHFTCKQHGYTGWQPQLVPRPSIDVANEEADGFKESIQELIEKRTVLGGKRGGLVILRADGEEKSLIDMITNGVARDGLISSAILDHHCARAAVGPFDLLAPGPTTAWTSHPAVQRYTEHGDETASFIDGIDHGSVLGELELPAHLVRIER